MQRLNKLFLPIILLVFVSCNGYYFKDKLSNILGVNNVEIENKFSINEYGGVHGDGIIFETYKLSKKTIIDFQNKIADTNKIKQIGQFARWKLTPIDSIYNEPLSMIIDYKSSNSNLDRKMQELNKAIRKKNVYYCLIYDEAKEDVHLFLLDINDNTLYAIDQQM